MTKIFAFIRLIVNRLSLLPGWATGELAPTIDVVRRASIKFATFGVTIGLVS